MAVHVDLCRRLNCAILREQSVVACFVPPVTLYHPRLLSRISDSGKQGFVMRYICSGFSSDMHARVVVGF